MLKAITLCFAVFFLRLRREKPRRIRTLNGRIQREFMSFAILADDLSLRLRSQLKTACTGCKKAVSTPISMMIKMMISGTLSCENMVGYSCSHYVGTRSLDASSHVFDERMFMLLLLNCDTAPERGFSKRAGLIEVKPVISCILSHRSDLHETGRRSVGYGMCTT
jgi:hypothetical protein